MFLVVSVSVSGTYFLANLALKHEFMKLPKDVQGILQSRLQGPRKHTISIQPPLPIIRTGHPLDAYLDKNWSSINVNGVVIKGHWSRTRDITVINGNRIYGNPNARNALRQLDFLGNVQKSLILSGILAATISAMLAWLLARRIAKPVADVSKAASQLAKGDLNARVSIYSKEREIKELASKFNYMANTLQHLEEERQQAVTDIAHELRTPLAVMQARLDALEDGVYPMNNKQIALLSEQTQLLTRLVGDLRTLTLLEAGQLQLKSQSLELGGLIEDWVDRLQDRAALKDIALTWQAPREEIWVEVDKDRLYQISLNLIENAMRYAKNQVWIHLERDIDVVRLHVDDDGHGIPAEQRQKIFTRFTRLDQSRNRDTGGSGLGLPIVQALAQAHGGGAEASQSHCGGARLTVWLPKNTPKAQDTTIGDALVKESVPKLPSAKQSAA